LPEQGGRTITAKRLKLQGEVVEPIKFLPDAVRFGVIRIGEMPEEDVSVASRTGRPFRVERVENAHSDIVCVRDQWRAQVFRVCFASVESGSSLRSG
jgi:hypothetical protein